MAQQDQSSNSRSGLKKDRNGNTIWIDGIGNANKQVGHNNEASMVGKVNGSAQDGICNKNDTKGDDNLNRQNGNSNTSETKGDKCETNQHGNGNKSLITKFGSVIYQIGNAMKDGFSTPLENIPPEVKAKLKTMKGWLPNKSSK
ncbi:hypothetical protein PFICI_05043 [Pestalotiopsis fici W106-1]|uniref:Uncharacterized protein n=1 Tax=Pestalotiopsis fici (strain W106-1 / CGMCC3.15140) TaxID=1229662 RepID=W3XCJ8_PESFW|nr:uncharacterized protein PFICI_05043 [Pestalotiopsis fici W106-1]ETS83167.1 hypothetical protein PFICI_05043 [Pestalotiopsis fici W106-1]